MNKTSTANVRTRHLHHLKRQDVRMTGKLDKIQWIQGMEEVNSFAGDVESWDTERGIVKQGYTVPDVEGETTLKQTAGQLSVCYKTPANKEEISEKINAK